MRFGFRCHWVSSCHWAYWTYSLPVTPGGWWLVNFAALFCLIWLATRQKKPPLLKFLLTTMWVFIFPSSISHFNLGQISILICLAMLLVIRFNKRLPDWVIGLLLAFSLIKPQLSVFFIPAYYFNVWQTKNWQSLLKLVGWTFAGVLLTLLPVMLLFPNWLPDFLTNLSNNPNWAHPSIFNRLIMGTGGQMLKWLIFGGGLAISLIIVAHSYNGNQNRDSIESMKKVEQAFLWVIALPPLFSPYIWSWDFVLLYPIIVAQLFKKQQKLKTTLVFLGYYILLGVYMAQKLNGQISELQYWWIPWVLVLLIGANSFLIDESGH
ncbi:MAG: DUF2029 domain-containing protein [Anaerolineaceae bacterium]|nr:DUF2029 domain-containing protein [Anaerolineaceae bacterium]